MDADARRFRFTVDRLSFEAAGGVATEGHAASLRLAVPDCFAGATAASLRRVLLPQQRPAATRAAHEAARCRRAARPPARATGAASFLVPTQFTSLAVWTIKYAVRWTLYAARARRGERAAAVARRAASGARIRRASARAERRGRHNV